MINKTSYHAIAAALLMGSSFVAMADSNATTVAKPQSADVGTAISDTAVTAKVKAKFLDDSRLKSTSISVNTANGVVTLTGAVPSSDAKSAAEEVAKSVDGVTGIDNQLQAPSLGSKIEKDTKHAAKATKREVSDSWITTKVKSSLLADSVTKGLKISVKTTNHVVTLSGTADSDAALDRAKVLAKQVNGVMSVDASAVTVVTSN